MFAYISPWISCTITTKWPFSKAWFSISHQFPASFQRASLRPRGRLPRPLRWPRARRPARQPSWPSRSRCAGRPTPAAPTGTASGWLTGARSGRAGKFKLEWFCRDGMIGFNMQILEIIFAIKLLIKHPIQRWQNIWSSALFHQTKNDQVPHLIIKLKTIFPVSSVSGIMWPWAWEGAPISDLT